jgi:capsule polysaccharide export protein KpsE/RkpR
MNDTNSKRTQRTPSEIIAETEAKLERLRIKQAKKDAQSNPEVASLLEAKAALQKEIREAKKILGNGPQSAQARIAKHEAWIRRITNEEVAASRILETNGDEIAAIDAQINERVSTIVKNFEANA